jgi:transposase
VILLNFSHPLTAAQVAQVEALTSGAVERVIEVKTQFDHQDSFVQQAKALVQSIGLTAEQWQTARLLINLPSLHVIAATVLAELHGRMGYFPAILRLKPIAGSTPPQFEVAEVINLQAVRDAARNERW